MPEYLAYRQEVEGLVRYLNEKWATDDWTPIVFDARDDYPRSVAALRRYDVLLVNPIRDGLNLVAKEGAVLNERDGVVVLSTEAGAFDELDGAVRAVNPFDVAATADAMAQALATSPGERKTEAAELRRRADRSQSTGVARRPVGRRRVGTRNFGRWPRGTPRGRAHRADRRRRRRPAR